MILSEDRLFPAEPNTRSIARRLYSSISLLPIISPHGHTNPRWFAENEPFPDPPNCSSFLIITSCACFTVKVSR